MESTHKSMIMSITLMAHNHFVFIINTVDVLKTYPLKFFLILTFLTDSDTVSANLFHSYLAICVILILPFVGV